jgi:hypothetical protein
VRERGDDTAHVRFALAATAAELMRHPAAGAAAAAADCDRFRVELENVSLIAPPGTLEGEPLRWAHAATRDAPRWHPR